MNHERSAERVLGFVCVSPDVRGCRVVGGYPVRMLFFGLHMIDKNNVLRAMNCLSKDYSDALGEAMILVVAVFDHSEREYSGKPLRIEAIPLMDTLRRKYKVIIEEV